MISLRREENKVRETWKVIEKGEGRGREGRKEERKEVEEWERIGIVLLGEREKQETGGK